LLMFFLQEVTEGTEKHYAPTEHFNVARGTDNTTWPIRHGTLPETCRIATI
jgi:hypothetical protein